MSSDLFLEKIDEILKRQLTQKSFDLWIGIRENISNKCWNRATSSTGKYHQKEDGRVPSVAEHVFEMIYSAEKIIHMFEGLINKDVIFLGIALHDAYKYGLVKSCKFTEERHDRIMAEIIKKNKKIFRQALNENDIFLLENSIRYHAGKWSTDSGKDFSLKDFTPEILFIHTLDMLSSRNVLKIIEDKK